MCVCVCVFRIFVLKIVVERWFWELKMLIGSLVELHAWLHSYQCFSFLEKLFLSNLDTSSIPPRHLAICRALKVFSYRNLNRSSTADGSNEKVHGPSIAFQHPVDRSSLISCVWCFCTSTLARHLYLSTVKSLTPFSTPLDTSFVKLYWGSIYTSSCNSNLISLDLSLNTSVFSTPKPLSLTPIFFLKVSSRFSSFGKLLFSHYSCISYFET